MKLSIGILEPLLSAGGAREQMPVVVIATVEGDIHDIGKNLVALMLKNYGFQVIDLGKDVPKETIVRAARENHASIIGLSALMTTTMQEMRHVIELAPCQKAWMPKSLSAARSLRRNMRTKSMRTVMPGTPRMR